MKLIYCPNCDDVVGLSRTWRTCLCGQAGGAYLDEVNAEINGVAIPLGFSNPSFLTAVSRQPADGRGREFTAFVIPRNSPSIKHTGER